MGKLHSFKCDDGEWAAAVERAARERTTMTDVLARAVRSYGAGEPAVLPLAAGGEDGVYTRPPVYTLEGSQAVAEAAAYIRGAEAERPGCGHAYPDRRASFGTWHCRKCGY